MNPSNSEMQLPPPVIEQSPQAAQPPEAAAGNPEQAAAPERALSTAQSAPAAAPPAIPPTFMPQVQTPAQQPAAQSSASTAGVTADDSDLIEKEWVNKAKQIVERTRDDPYKQSEELTLVKADYMKKRYGKTIKLNT